MSFEYLSVEDQNEIEDAFIKTIVTYNQITRTSLLRGINKTFIANFLGEVSGGSMAQLQTDLTILNNVERLNDGSIPFEQWLRNATRPFSKLPQLITFENAINTVQKISRSPIVTIKSEELPSIGNEEVITGEVDDFQNVSFLSLGVQRISGVAKILVPRFENEKKITLPDGTSFISSGTGWLISKSFLLTNYHVIKNRAQYENEPSEDDLHLQVNNAQAHFFFHDEGQEGKQIAISELIAFGRDSTKDFALLKLSETLKDVQFLPVLNEQVKLPNYVQANKSKAIKPLAVNIIQHPGGGPKRVALRNNLVYSAEYPTLHYYTDTLGGSSGSPVFDDNWRVIALHRAAIPKQTKYNGKTLGYVNQGIQIHSILATLAKLAEKDEKVSVALDEIKKEQNLST